MYIIFSTAFKKKGTNNVFFVVDNNSLTDIFKYFIAWKNSHYDTLCAIILTDFISYRKKNM